MAAGEFATRPLHPRVLALVGKFGAFIILGLLLQATVSSARTGEAWTTTLGGGMHGTLIVDSCQGRRQSYACTGHFVSDPGSSRVNLHDLELLPKGRDLSGGRVGARVGGPDSHYAYQDGRFAQVSDLLQLVILTVAAVAAWPVRAAIHLFRPQVWPRWVYEKGPNRQRQWPPPSSPAIVRIFARVALGLAVLTVLADAYSLFGNLVLVISVICLAIIGWRRYRKATRPHGSA